MSKSAASVLVVLPTLGDRLEFLKETLESVERQRADLDLTLVVVTPLAAESARALALTYGAILVEDPKSGISAAINCGLTARNGEEYYAWVGDDDLFRDGGLALLKKQLDEDDRAVVAYGGCDYVDPDGNTLWVSAAGNLAKTVLAWGPNLIPNPAAMIRFDALEAVGGFDEELRYAMDLDVFLSLRRHGRFVALRQSVAAFRWHPASTTVANRRASSLEAERVKRKHLPTGVRVFSPLWAVPVRWASAIAASRVTARARAFDGK